MPTETSPKATSIAAGQAFIGGCATRANALSLYTTRVFQILVLNMAGLIGATTWLGSSPTWHMLTFYMVALVLGLRRFYLLSRQIISGSAANVDLWTNKLILLERHNPIDGGIAFFSSLDYAAQRASPSLPKNDALWILRVYMVLWVLSGVTASGLLAAYIWSRWHV